MLFWDGTNFWRWEIEYKWRLYPAGVVQFAASARHLFTEHSFNSLSFTSSFNYRNVSINWEYSLLIIHSSVMSYNNFFLRIIGIGEARFGMIWFMLAILSMLIHTHQENPWLTTGPVGFIANIVVLVSCASPDTQAVHLFKVGSAELVNATANVTGISPSKLQMAELPEYWYWGFSGNYLPPVSSACSCTKTSFT